MSHDTFLRERVAPNVPARLKHPLHAHNETHQHPSEDSSGRETNAPRSSRTAFARCIRCLRGRGTRGAGDGLLLSCVGVTQRGRDALRRGRRRRFDEEKRCNEARISNCFSILEPWKDIRIGVPSLMRCPFPLVRISMSSTGIPCMDCEVGLAIVGFEEMARRRTLFELRVCCVAEF